MDRTTTPTGQAMGAVARMAIMRMAAAMGLRWEATGAAMAPACMADKHMVAWAITAAATVATVEWAVAWAECMGAVECMEAAVHMAAECMAAGACTGGLLEFMVDHWASQVVRIPCSLSRISAFPEDCTAINCVCDCAQ